MITQKRIGSTRFDKPVSAQSQSKKATKLILSFALAASLFTVPTLSPDAATKTAYENRDTYHIVKKGNTMYSIAKLHKMPVERLMDANYKLDTTIYVGEKIRIPAKNWPWDGRIFAPGEKLTSPYFVGSGDTLYNISKRAGTTVSKLKKMNNLKSNYIQVGQLLKISGKNVQK